MVATDIDITQNLVSLGSRGCPEWNVASMLRLYEPNPSWRLYNYVDFRVPFVPTIEQSDGRRNALP